MKKFFKKTEGFTLVELIVVIAILGILAGVGTVGYSGYIKKANETIDKQLIRDVQYAAQLGMASDPTTMGVTGTILIPHKNDTDTYTADELIRVDGSDAAAKAAKVAVIDGWMEAAFGAEWENTVRCKSSNYEAAGMPVMISSATVQAAMKNFFNSNIAKNPEVVMTSADSLATGFDSWIEKKGLSELNKYMSNEEYSAFVEEYGLDSSSDPTKVANSMILYMADNSSGVSAEDVLTEMGTNGITGVQAKYGALPSAAMMYGVMAGYANSEYASEDFKTSFEKTPEGITDVATLFDQMTKDAKFNTYYTATEKGLEADLDGYLAALEVINENAYQVDTESGNVFADPYLQALVNSVLQAG